LQIAQEIVQGLLSNRSGLDLEAERNKLEKFVQLVYVLEQDPFEGLNRKIQLKPVKHEEICVNESSG